jgi:ligand-binding SRPBCC domain-containing protein
MTSAIFQTEQWVDTPLELAFRFFAQPGNLEKISPHWSGARLLGAKLVPPSVASARPRDANVEKLAGAGSEIVVSFFLLPYIPITNSWTARVVEFEWNRYFRDIQIKGPFMQFDHTHSFEQAGQNGHSGTLIRDTIRYHLGFGALGKLLDDTIVRFQLSAMFRYRQRATARILARGENG